MIAFHRWYPGKKEQYGSYIYRDDTCDCGCVRRVVLNDEDRQEIESYTVKEEIFTVEPPCEGRVRKTYKTNLCRRH